MKSQLNILLVSILLLCHSLKAQTFEKVSNVEVDGNPEPYVLTVYDGRLYFAAFDSVHSLSSYGLWSSDGTSSGTQLIAAGLKPDQSGAYPNIIYNGKLYFSPMIPGGIFVTDGTMAGTQMVKNLNVAGFFAFTNYNNKFYFQADSVNRKSGLWESDGTSAGTQLVWRGNAYSPTVFNNELYFEGSDSTGKSQGLYLTDGAPGSTHIFWKGSASDFTIFKSRLYFLGSDSIGKNVGVWESDGTLSGTYPIWKTGDQSHPLWFTTYNNQLIFTSIDDSLTKSMLWESDGTAAGTQYIKEWATTNMLDEYIIYDGKLYFDAFDSLGNKIGLWISDGTSNGTKMIWQSPGNSPSLFTIYKGELYFIAYDSVPFKNINGNYVYNIALYVIKGNNSSVQLVKPTLAAVGKSSIGGPLVVYNGSLYFTAQFDSTNVANYLWKFTSNSSGIKEQFISNGSISAFPNPVTTNDFYLHVRNDFKGNLQLQSMEGKVLLNQQLEQSGSLETIPVQLPGSIPNGMYLITLTTNTGAYNQKILVQRP